MKSLQPALILLCSACLLAVGCESKEASKEVETAAPVTDSATAEAPEKPDAEAVPAAPDSPVDPSDATSDPPAAADPPAVSAHPLSAPNNPPELELPIYERVGVGQTIGFGVEVIDHELDEFRVDLIQKPSSATYDPYTLTIEWTPTADDQPSAEFAFSITETVRATGAKRKFTHRFGIEVLDAPQAMPHARVLGRAVEQLITIHDPVRLAEVNARWPLDKLLVKAAEMHLRHLPEDERKTLAELDAAALYKSVLKAQAVAHSNPELDPDSPLFDADKWGDPKVWKVIAIRPRLDKKWQEIRMVYKSDTPEAAYLMPRFRPVDQGAKTEEEREYNNKAFSKIVATHFFTEDGKLNPAHAKDRAAHAEATANFVDAVIGYSGEHDWAKGGFIALPAGARLGGGSVRDESGLYLHGDGWAWHNNNPSPKDGQYLFDVIPIKGFVSGVAAKEDKSGYQMRCASLYNSEAGDAHDPRYANLCRKSGHTDMPATGDGFKDEEGAASDAAIVSAKIDSANRFIAHKTERMVETIALEDPRRDLFEEKGMTCHQCHVRGFGVRDMYDPTAADPSAGLPKARNKRQATTFFVITPTERWEPYAIDFQHKQECKSKVALESYLGLTTDLECPLRAE